MIDSDFLLGSPDAYVLETLSRGPMHGYGIFAWMEDADGEHSA